MQTSDLDPAAAAPRPRFAPAVTVACLVLWVTAVVLGAVSGLVADDAIANFRAPSAVARSAVERPLLITEAMARLSRDELGDLVAGLGEDLDGAAQLEDAADLYRDIAARLERVAAEAEDEGQDSATDLADAARELRLRGAVLAHAAGREDWDEWLVGEDPRLDVARRGLAGEPVDDPAALLESLEPAYSTALLGRRIAEAAGDTAAADAWETWIDERGRALLRRLGLLAAIAAAVGSVGFVALGFFVFAPRDALRLDPPAVRNRFPETADGIGLFARYGLAFLVVSTAVALLTMGLADGGLSPLLGVTALIGSAPIVLFARAAWRHDPPGTLAAALGLRLDGARAWRLGPLVAGGWLAAVVGIVAISTAATFLRPSSDLFANPFFDVIVGSTTTERLRLLVEACLWAPLFEELAFRAALFGGLRRRLNFLPAALLSSALFALAHPYDFVGVLTIGWVGFVLAAVYERTRCLWAPILVHFLFNFGQLQFSFALLG